MSSIIIAGPSRERRAGFIEALRDTPHSLAAETGRVDNVLALLHQLQPWCVAVDLAFPDRAGVNLARQILTRFPQVTVVVLFDEKTADHAAEARRAGASDALYMPVEAPRLLRCLTSLSNPHGEVATRKLMAVRHKTTLAMTYKAANEGFLTRRRPAVAMELGLMELVMQTEEAFAAGRELVATIHLPGQGSLSANLRVVRAEPGAAFGRYDVVVAWHELKTSDRDRLKAFCRQMLSKVPSGVPAVVG